VEHVEVTGEEGRAHEQGSAVVAPTVEQTFPIETQLAPLQFVSVQVPVGGAEDTVKLAAGEVFVPSVA
jgi:hypothetical protein